MLSPVFYNELFFHSRSHFILNLLVSKTNFSILGLYLFPFYTYYYPKKGATMEQEKQNSKNCHRTSVKAEAAKNGKPPKEGSVEPLPESSRPRQDGPGGN